MRIIPFIVGIIVFSILLFVYFYEHFVYHAFQYRVVRLGYIQFYQLMDSLFNEFSDPESDPPFDDEIERIMPLGPVRDDVADSEPQLACYTWSSLSELIGVDHQRVINASKILRSKPNVMKDYLAKPLGGIQMFIQNYNARLKMAHDRIPSYFTMATKFLESINDTLNAIGKDYHTIVPNAIEKIDEDHRRSLKTIIVRFAKILQQFENVIQSQNDAQLECTCDVAKLLDKVIVDVFEHDMDQCVTEASEMMEYHIKDNQMPMTHYVETTLFMANGAMKKSKSSIDSLYQLPMQVCEMIMIFQHLHTFFFILIKIYNNKFQLSSADAILRMLHVQQKTAINALIDDYVACQEKKLKIMFKNTKELLIELKKCIEIKDFVKYSFTVY